MGIVEMMVLLILKREKVPLKRDILFFAANGEETGGQWGVQWAMENVPSLMESEYALNEGGYVILDEDGTPNRYEISNGQKVIFQLRLKATGHIRSCLHAHGRQSQRETCPCPESARKLGNPFYRPSHGEGIFSKDGPETASGSEIFL